jgi:hypothetical protein
MQIDWEYRQHTTRKIHSFWLGVRYASAKPSLDAGSCTSPSLPPRGVDRSFNLAFAVREERSSHAMAYSAQRIQPFEVIFDW